EGDVRMIAVEARGRAAHEPTEGRIEDRGARGARRPEVRRIRVDAGDLEREVRQAGEVAAPHAHARGAVPGGGNPTQADRRVRGAAALDRSVVRPHGRGRAPGGNRRELVIGAPG